MQNYFLVLAFFEAFFFEVLRFVDNLSFRSYSSAAAFEGRNSLGDMSKWSAIMLEDYFFFFKEGEEQGFNYFFHLYYKPLVHFAHSFLNNKQAAEDVAEESLIKLWERREAMDSLNSIKSFLYAVTRNSCIDALRKARHQTAYMQHLQKSPGQLAPDVTQQVILSEAMSQVYLALQNMPAKYGKVFTMLYVQGKEMKDIAQELNLPLSTVKSQKARALELLRKQLPHLGCFRLSGALLLQLIFHRTVKDLDTIHLGVRELRKFGSYLLYY